MDDLLPLSLHAFEVRRAEDWRYDASLVIVRYSLERRHFGATWRALASPEIEHHRLALAEDARKLRRALTYNGLTLVGNEGEILKLSFSATAAGHGAAASQDDPEQKRKDQCADAHGDGT